MRATIAVSGVLAVLLSATAVQAVPYADSSQVNLVHWPGVSLPGSAGSAAFFTDKGDPMNAPYNWGAPGGTKWLQLDLGAGNEQMIDRLRTRHYPGQQCPGIEMWVGNDPTNMANNTKVLNITSNSAALTDDTFTPTSGRYARVQFSGNTGWYGLYDLAIYSTDVKQQVADYPISERGAGAATIARTAGLAKLSDGSGAETNGTNLLSEDHAWDAYATHGEASTHRTYMYTQDSDVAFEITLDRLYDLDHAEFTFLNNANFQHGGVKIEASVDGVSFVTAYEDSSPNTGESALLNFADPTLAMYLKVTFKQNAGKSGFHAFRTDFYGEPAATEVIPEPATLCLLGLGGLAGLRRRRR